MSCCRECKGTRSKTRLDRGQKQIELLTRIRQGIDQLLDAQKEMVAAQADMAAAQKDMAVAQKDVAVAQERISTIQDLTGKCSS